ncbi:MAG: hypothetical protein ACMXYK_01930 [Candidatus Woesearchaeota archaeon]
MSRYAVWLGTFLYVATAVFANPFAESFRYIGMTPAEFLEFYNSYYLIIDGILVFLFFGYVISDIIERVGNINAPKAFKVVGVILSLGFIFFQAQSGFQLLAIGMVPGILLVFSILSYYLWILVREHTGGVLGASGVYIVVFLMMSFVVGQTKVFEAVPFLESVWGWLSIGFAIALVGVILGLINYVKSRGVSNGSGVDFSTVKNFAGKTLKTGKERFSTFMYNTAKIEQDIVKTTSLITQLENKALHELYKELSELFKLYQESVKKEKEAINLFKNKSSRYNQDVLQIAIAQFKVYRAKILELLEKLKHTEENENNLLKKAYESFKNELNTEIDSLKKLNDSCKSDFFRNNPEFSNLIHLEQSELPILQTFDTEIKNSIEILKRIHELTQTIKNSYNGEETEATMTQREGLLSSLRTDFASLQESFQKQHEITQQIQRIIGAIQATVAQIPSETNNTNGGGI